VKIQGDEERAVVLRDRPFPRGRADVSRWLPRARIAPRSLSRSELNAFQPHALDPYGEAPRTDPNGGVIYFGSGQKRADIKAVLRVLEVPRDTRHYAAFLQESQDPPTGTLIWRFIAEEERRYGLHGTEGLYGTFGGDGDRAKEELCFGFLIENADLGVYRIWSRGWLVMK
jgi:hypothetical protein